jgi:TetR/AcrR family transcriptional repressor of nem operon
MKVTREEAQRNRERVIEGAAKLYREHGFDGVGVADLMKSAGLTHGAFYGQFESKDELMAHACAKGFEQALKNWDKACARAPGAEFEEIVRTYLSDAHRDKPGYGCVVAALGGEVARQSEAVRASVGEGVALQIEALSTMVTGGTPQARRARAIQSFATLVGAMVLARAVNGDPLSDEILETVAQGMTRAR